MNMQKLAVVLTMVNLGLMLILLGKFQPASAKNAHSSPDILRARGLEIVDKTGKTRASITIEPPVEMNGKKYPEAVLLRLINSERSPVVKLSATDKGSSLNISDEADGGIRIISRSGEDHIEVRDGSKQKIIRP
ncbi:MAG: hypothetical protein INR69_19185 [Mucilaginibacter polytrichastri]|nr:hypothetical protein [Mucilaginibacter polytrichastri]